RLQRCDRLAENLEVALLERAAQTTDDRDIVDAAIDARIVHLVRLDAVAAAVLGRLASDLRRRQSMIEAALAAAHGGGAEGDRERNRVGADRQRHGADRVAQLVAD